MTKDVRWAAERESGEVLAGLESGPGGLTAREAELRLRRFGRNAVEERRAGFVAILGRQLANPFLILLVVTAVLSLALGDHNDAAIILAIILLSVGLSCVDEYRSAKAVDDLRARIRRTALALRDGAYASVPVDELVPGDVVKIAVGDIVPADVRLLQAQRLECDEAALTGEPFPASKTAAPCAAPAPLGLACCAYLGTVVKNGTATAVVVSTGRSAVFGAIAHRLAAPAPRTAFEAGLVDFSMLLVRITVALTVAIVVLNALLHHAWLESLMFALAIAIGITPQLLPAVVTIALSAGARRLAKRSVVVKSLVSIEDLGNVEVLFTDKTGTLTRGEIELRDALDAAGQPSAEVRRWSLVCNDAVWDGREVAGGNALDVALATAATPSQRAEAQRYAVRDRIPFDYDRRLMTVLADAPGGPRLLISKGAPEAILARCAAVPDAARALIDRELAAGSRVVALAVRETPALDAVTPADEHDLELRGILTFADEPKPSAAESVRRLRELGIELKILTGDNDVTAQRVCREIDLPASGVLTGERIDALTTAELIAALPRTTIFARVTPEQKARLITLQRSLGADVGFLGDGVNDAEALHAADVGISVDSATDVAKDAASIVLLEKDLGILADGVVEGRRIFANTIKYVLMGTSSNFGNMFSAAAASLVLPFLPMLPSQILLNNLLYDGSEMAIPTDRVDEEQLRRPAHWDMAFIRRFMLFFGPISSLFDFGTFALMLYGFRAGPALFRSGWFVESLATQSLVIFAIRTRRIPFFRSRPSLQLAAATIAVAAIGAVLPFTAPGRAIGFAPLPPAFFGALAVMIALYVALIELGKRIFFAREGPVNAAPRGVHTPGTAFSAGAARLDR